MSTPVQNEIIKTKEESQARFALINGKHQIFSSDKNSFDCWRYSTVLLILVEFIFLRFLFYRLKFNRWVVSRRSNWRLIFKRGSCWLSSRTKNVWTRRTSSRMTEVWPRFIAEIIMTFISWQSLTLSEIYIFYHFVKNSGHLFNWIGR